MFLILLNWVFGGWSHFKECTDKTRLLPKLCKSYKTRCQARFNLTSLPLRVKCGPVADADAADQTTDTRTLASTRTQTVLLGFLTNQLLTITIDAVTHSRPGRSLHIRTRTRLFHSSNNRHHLTEVLPSISGLLFILFVACDFLFQCTSRQ